MILLALSHIYSTIHLLVTHFLGCISDYFSDIITLPQKDFKMDITDRSSTLVYGSFCCCCFPGRIYTHWLYKLKCSIWWVSESTYSHTPQILVEVQNLPSLQTLSCALFQPVSSWPGRFLTAQILHTVIFPVLEFHLSGINNTHLCHLYSVSISNNVFLS